MTLDCDQIQGNVVPGFNKDHQAFVFLRFGTQAGARRWLGQIAQAMTSATVAQGFKERFKQLRAEAPHPDQPDGGALSHISATWINLGLSFAGLRLLLGSVQANRFPATFRRCQVPGADRPPTDVHALLIVAADLAEDLEAELTRQRQRMSDKGVDEVMTMLGDTLPGDQRGHEHFGFKDAISQPHIAGTNWGKGPEVAAGEFVLGYPDQTGKPSGAGMPEWTRNGSFLAFVQLQQHVGAFWKSMKRQAQIFGVQPEEVAEWIVGRHLDAEGTPLAKDPSRVSHIGRAYPRWLSPSDSLRHRILRRGIPYGPSWADSQPDDGRRGLLFVTYQADIERQFEHVWTRWLNALGFPVPSAGRDALAGQVSWPVRSSSTGTRAAVAVRAGGSGEMVSLNLPAFVTPHYGGYFFAPAIDALSQIASIAPTT